MYEHQNDKLQKGTADTQAKAPSKKEPAAALGSNRPRFSALPAQCKQSEEHMNDLHTSLIEKLNRTKENKTGLPDRLKEGVESMSGFCLDDVRVHFNSEKPAQLQAYAYTQGLNIYVAPGQEKHLPHEAWHTVQQMQGRVKSNYEINHIGINDNAGLEREATVMGSRAANYDGWHTALNDSFYSPLQMESVAQLERFALNNRNNLQDHIIGINLMPSGGLKEVYTINGRGYSNLSNKIAGHSSLIAGQLDDRGQLVLEQGRGFSPNGFWNSMRVGIAGFLGLNNPSVPGSYHHEDQAIVDDPEADQVTIYVSADTYARWVELMDDPDMHRAGGNDGTYSYQPQSGTMDHFSGGGSDNCTTVAFRTASRICDTLANDEHINEDDRAALGFLQERLGQMMGHIVDKNRRAGTTKGTQGRAMSAVNRFFGRQRQRNLPNPELVPLL